MTPTTHHPVRIHPDHRAKESSSRAPFSRAWLACFVGFQVLFGFALPAAEPSAARAMLRTGDYEKAIEAAHQAIQAEPGSEEWSMILGQGLFTVGRYPEARSALTNGVAHNPRSLRLRWLGREACFAAGDTNQAVEYLDEIRSLVSNQGGSYRDPRSLVALARSALRLGADPKIVLDRVLEPARLADPDLVETYLARGELALEKHDADLAARAFGEGLKKHSDDPDLHFGMARAHVDGDRAVLVESLESALRINGRHVPSMLLLADHRIDAEDYAEATKLLDEIGKVNPWNADAWCYRAVLAHLRNDAGAEASARTNAFHLWTTNPRVDHLIGLKLSQKYRFAEGAAHQRQSLAADPEYLPAKAQLASDLLRLGDEDEGWRLAREVHDRDGYDVSAYNLVTLNDTMRRYTTLTNAHFVVRLSSHEAEVYGPRVLELLERARASLSVKYGIEPKAPTLVEIFAEQKDFGVRTFGMPENPGFLGVCFGRVVTANGPAATHGRDSNWEAVLWHEFTHVITLQLTANRMPRWLSEGISVHEELEANPAWGQRMSPRYRTMILGGELVPISHLSSAFLTPKSPFHLQFAYFESCLVVDHIVRRHGIESLKAVLRDLRDGVDINAALAARTAPMKDLEKSFAEFAANEARGLAPALDWEKPPASEPTAASEKKLDEWLRAHPTNYWALRQTSQRAMADKEWTNAKPILERLVRLFPEQTGADSAYPMLAAAHRALGETNAEQRVLVEYAARDREATEAYLRLMELGTAGRDWPEVRLNAERFLAVNPLVPPPYRHLAESAEATGDPAAAIQAYRTLLRLDPPNPADTHFQLARLLQTTDPADARRHVLRALEESPRHRPALQLLLALPANTNAPASAPDKIVLPQ